MHYIYMAFYFDSILLYKVKLDEPREPLPDTNSTSLSQWQKEVASMVEGDTRELLATTLSLLDSLKEHVSI